jgi:pilus assembly protein CpaC
MRPSRIRAALLLTLAALAAAGPARARDPLGVELGKGQVVRLPRAAATVFVADPAVADVQVKSPTLLYLFGKAIGETTLIAADAEDGIILDAPVRVTHNLARLRDTLRELVPGASLAATSVAGSVVLEGEVASPREAEDARRAAAAIAGGETNVINRLRVSAPTQVNLRVRVAEMSRAVTKELGFSLSANGQLGNFALGVASLNPFAVGASSSVAAAGRLGRWDVNGVIDALEQDQLVKVLAEPNLTAMSGETASFLAGGEFPIVSESKDDEVTVTFKQFGVSLAFTPTVLGDGRINLHVRPEVSELTTTGAIQVAGYSIPALATRRAETTVELASGQSFAVAGLLRQDADQSVSRFPGLGDVPILGALFRSTQFQRNETELVIIVTPYAVQPAAERGLAAPTDGVLPPHDVERLLFGARWRRENPRTAAARGLAGPVGFELR